MVVLFKKSKFFLAVAAKMSYEDGTQFTENNVVQYLAELEEYISSLITYAAFKREEPHAAISAIPLEKLNIKDYTKKEANIDAPVGYDIKQDKSQADQQPVEEDIIDSKQLYKKFMGMIEND